MYPKLRAAGWNGYWIDAAKALRMKRRRGDHPRSGEPRRDRRGARRAACSNYIGGNCTVSLMMMALAGLFERDLVEWMTCMTYQAASGAGAQNMRELLQQMGEAHLAAKSAARRSARRRSSTSIARSRASCATSASRPSTSACRSPGSLIPWIDKDLGNGMSREEWKGGAEANKILGRGAGGDARSRSSRCACASARCAATARR